MTTLGSTAPKEAGEHVCPLLSVPCHACGPPPPQPGPHDLKAANSPATPRRGPQSQVGEARSNCPAVTFSWARAACFSR